MTIRRVLIAQPYGIGDLLFVTPVLRALRLIPTVETVDLLLGSRTDAILQANPHVDEIETIDKDLFHRRGSFQNLEELQSLWKKLRRRNYDLLLDFSLRGEYAFLSQFFLGIRQRAGFDYKSRGFFHNRRLKIPHGFSGRHVVDYFCDLAELTGIPVEDRFLEFYLTEEERQQAGLLIREKIGEKNFMAVSPGGGESWGKDAHFKRWPVRYFADLIVRLKDNLEFEKVLIFGSHGEKGLGEELKTLLPFESVNLSGELPLRMTAAFLEKAAFFIGNDGGLVHLAHAFQIPLIAFYGPVDPAVYGPYPSSSNAVAVFKEDLSCRPCYQSFRYNSACIGRECLQQLTPDEVLRFLEIKGFWREQKFSKI